MTTPSPGARSGQAASRVVVPKLDLTEADSGPSDDDSVATDALWEQRRRALSSPRSTDAIQTRQMHDKVTGKPLSGEDPFSRESARSKLCEGASVILSHSKISICAGGAHNMYTLMLTVGTRIVCVQTWKSKTLA